MKEQFFNKRLGCITAIKLGVIVILESKENPRGLRLLTQVTEVIRTGDQEVRFVKLKTLNERVFLWSVNQTFC